MSSTWKGKLTEKSTLPEEADFEPTDFEAEDFNVFDTPGGGFKGILEERIAWSGKMKEK